MNKDRCGGVILSCGPYASATRATRAGLVTSNHGGCDVIVESRRQFPPDLPVSDVCIVGGGPAGISLAMRLERSGLSVLILESGGPRETTSYRDLNRGTSDPPGSHEPLEENRRRQWGGASSVWGGRCIPFDEVDFLKRDWAPLSGWPFARSELDPYYSDAMELCEAGEMDFDARTALPTAPDLIPGLDGDGIVTYPIERWSPPTHFGKRYRKYFASSPRIVALLNATCTHIQLSASGDHVDHLVVQRSNGDRHTIRARHYVLATGGLENTRLLLASNDVATEGIGNHSDCLGRFYQTHLFGCHAQLVLTSRDPLAHVTFDRDSTGVYCRRRIWIDAETQESAKILNIVFFPTRPPSGATGHRSAIFSGVYIVKTLLAAVRRPANAAPFLRNERKAIGGHLRVLAQDLPRAIPELLQTIVGRYLGSRRLPVVLPPDGLQSYYLQFQSEQTPNPTARLSLTTERDAFEVPRLVVAPHTTMGDIESVIQAHRLLDERLRRSSLGFLEYDEAELRQSLTHSTQHVNSAAHHLGTTRMSSDPRHGVVDSDCRVHGVRNLYVVGGSVMPTSGHANPTLTVLALALRLADHLAEHASRSDD